MGWGEARVKGGGNGMGGARKVRKVTGSSVDSGDGAQKIGT